MTERRKTQKTRADNSIRAAYATYAESMGVEKTRLLRQNASIEAEQRRQAMAHLEQRNNRRQQLLEQRATHQTQIAEREKFFSADRARQIEGDGGLVSRPHCRHTIFSRHDCTLHCTQIVEDCLR